MEKVELTGGEFIHHVNDKDNDTVYLVLNKKQENNVFILYNINNKDVIETNINSYNYIRTLDEMAEYRWLGIEYLHHKILIDLKTLNIEQYRYDIGQWDFIDDIAINESDNHLLINLLEVMIRVDIDKLTVCIIDSTSGRFKGYYNFLLGEEDEYVFNEFLELELSK